MKDLFNLKVLFLLVPALLVSCDSVSQSRTGNFIFPFNLEKPTNKFLLPAELSEISGIAFNDGKIICIQDESANIYVFDPIAGKVTSKFVFGKSGDFEDIAINGSIAYLLKSSGTLVEVRNFSSDKRDFTELKTPLSPKNDTEGLAYDASTGSLIISCKEYPWLIEDSKRGFRTIYRYIIKERRLETEPYVAINLSNPEGFSSKEIFDEFQLFRETRPEISGFKPSGIAFHPSSKDLYVISGSGRLILVLDTTRKIKLFGYLPPNIFAQPEGICFSPEGNLFISNEGKGTIGNILSFEKKK